VIPLHLSAQRFNIIAAISTDAQRMRLKRTFSWTHEVFWRQLSEVWSKLPRKVTVRYDSAEIVYLCLTARYDLGEFARQPICQWIDEHIAGFFADERVVHEKIDLIIQLSSESKRRRLAFQNIVRAFDDLRRSGRPHLPLFSMCEDAMTESSPLVKFQHFMALLDAIFAFIQQFFSAADVGADEMSEASALFYLIARPKLLFANCTFCWCFCKDPA
jgi:hypothetical protein